jgi:hypothetical protein
MGSLSLIDVILREIVLCSRNHFKLNQPDIFLKAFLRRFCTDVSLVHR